MKDSEAIIIVEGRSDVLNLLKAGIKNAIAVEGTNIPKTVQELSRERVATAFVDGDRGGELILRELFQVAEVDFVARAPRAHEVEELTAKQIIKCLRNKVPGDQYMEMNGLVTEQRSLEEIEEEEDREEKHERRERRKERDEEHRERRKEREERRERRGARGSPRRSASTARPSTSTGRSPSRPQPRSPRRSRPSPPTSSRCRLPRGPSPSRARPT